ncbi:MAG: hypothetical protein E6Q56_01080 [Mycobacterium sp.]|nr:MAG: hypothetical protein E6Q56_01080 [Mycobacterium sp.]HPZ94445.1 hypothetical protein [Mycobacterium sp.]
MSWKRPHHTRWLVACALAFLAAGNVGGFSFPVGMVFLVIFVVGAVLLSADETGGGIASGMDGSDADYPVTDYPDDAFEEVPDESPAEGATPGEAAPDSVDGDTAIDDVVGDVVLDDVVGDTAAAAVSDAPEPETPDVEAPGAQPEAPGSSGTARPFDGGGPP